MSRRSEKINSALFYYYDSLVARHRDYSMLEAAILAYAAEQNANSCNSYLSFLSKIEKKHTIDAEGVGNSSS